MSFSRWYPVSSYYYDPAIQPTKTLSNLQHKDESKLRKVPIGRFDTTYRREYLNFNNAFPNQGNPLQQYAINNPPPQTQQSLNSEKSNLNPFSVLPPINSTQSSQIFQQNNFEQNYPTQTNEPSQFEQVNSNEFNNVDNYLPQDAVYLSAGEEQSLVNDVGRELMNVTSNQLKNLYSDMSSYDPSLNGFIHYNDISSSLIRNNFLLNENTTRFLLSKFVSPSQPRGFVNYEELIKYLARCLGEAANNSNKNRSDQMPSTTQSPRGQLTSRSENLEKYDPDEQAILRLMHENLREFDQVNLIDCENLRKKLHEIDLFNKGVLSQREIEEVLYKTRIPIQRSLTSQVLEKYCKVATGRYKWMLFVDFLEKVYHLRLPNKKKTDYVIREDEKDKRVYEFTYRDAKLDALKVKEKEKERLDEINRQIYSSMSNKTENKFSSFNLVNNKKPEFWFTRFMRLANAMYSHRLNARMEFLLPKEEARNLIFSYNALYNLNIAPNVIDESINQCLVRNNVKIDQLLKVLSKVNYER